MGPGLSLLPMMEYAHELHQNVIRRAVAVAISLGSTAILALRR